MLRASLGKVVHTVKRAGTYAAKVPPKELHKIAVHVRAVDKPVSQSRIKHTRLFSHKRQRVRRTQRKSAGTVTARRQAATAVAEPAPGDSASVLTRRGIAAGTGHYCVTGRPRSSGKAEPGCVSAGCGPWRL
jgi:hypothetical protein